MKLARSIVFILFAGAIVMAATVWFRRASQQSSPERVLNNAAGLSNSEFVKELDKAHNINARDSSHLGWTPLIAAIYYHKEDNIDTLLSRKVLVNVGDDQGDTPLMWAITAWGENTNLLVKLIQHGADPTIKSKYGRNAFDAARSRSPVVPAIEPLLQQSMRDSNQINDAPNKGPAEMMREMRLKQLTMAPSELSQKPTAEFPQVCAVLMDWPIEAGIVTAVARTTGDASVYSDGTFGVFGGIGHESVRKAATNCVKVAGRHFESAVATKDFPYPKPGRVRFYLVGYDGVRVIDADLAAVRNGQDKCSDLYQAAQGVLTELRLVTQQQRGERQ